jgi:hypothetical protein
VHTVGKLLVTNIEVPCHGTLCKSGSAHQLSRCYRQIIWHTTCRVWVDGNVAYYVLLRSNMALGMGNRRGEKLE